MRVEIRHQHRCQKDQGAARNARICAKCFKIKKATNTPDDRQSDELRSSEKTVSAVLHRRAVSIARSIVLSLYDESANNSLFVESKVVVTESLAVCPSPEAMSSLWLSQLGCFTHRD